MANTGEEACLATPTLAAGEDAALVPLWPSTGAYPVVGPPQGDVPTERCPPLTGDVPTERCPPPRSPARMGSGCSITCVGAGVRCLAELLDVPPTRSSSSCECSGQRAVVSSRFGHGACSSGGGGGGSAQYNVGGMGPAPEHIEAKTVDTDGALLWKYLPASKVLCR